MNEEIHFSEEMMNAEAMQVRQKSLLLCRVEFAVTPKGPGVFFSGNARYQETFDALMGPGWFAQMLDMVGKAARGSEAEKIFGREMDKAIVKMAASGRPDEETV